MEPYQILPENKLKYRGQIQVYYKAYQHNPERCEKEFLIKCLQSMPIEKLKGMLNFELIDPMDKKQPETYSEAEYRENLFQKQVVEFRSEIII